MTLTCCDGFHLKKQFTRLLRWILFLWVRVEAFPQPDPAAGIDPDRPVLYLLTDRLFSDLLVSGQKFSNRSTGNVETLSMYFNEVQITWQDGGVTAFYDAASQQF